MFGMNIFYLIEGLNFFFGLGSRVPGASSLYWKGGARTQPKKRPLLFLTKSYGKWFVQRYLYINKFLPHCWIYENVIPYHV